jgi:hypothetical protein
MARKPTKAQAAALARLATGDHFRPRYHSQFCFSEREKWVDLWDSDKSIASKATTDALYHNGWYLAGGITEAGREALARLPSPQQQEMK